MTASRAALVLAPLLAIGLAGCQLSEPTSDGGATDAAVGGFTSDEGLARGPVGLFELDVLAAPDPSAMPSSTIDFFALPYPNALRLDADGTPALARFARTSAFLDGYVDVIDRTGHGFGPTQAAYFRFDAALDPSTLPADVAASIADGASVFFVDVTAGAPHFGERVPIQTKFSEAVLSYIGADWLAVQPVPGFPPRAGETYAVVLTDGLRGPGGAAQPAAAFARVLANTPSDAGGAVETQAAAAYAPLRAYLATRPALAGHVVAATVYTTSAPTSYIDALRTAVLATPAPVLGDLAFESATSTYDLYSARYDSPNFQEGDVPYATSGGAIHYTGGVPSPVRTETLRVAISVPLGTMPAAGWPVLLYEPGTGGDYHSFVNDGTAARYAADAAHFAVISIDPVISGTRAPAGTDPATAFFNLQNLVAARDNAKQGALDGFQLLRLVTSIDVASAPGTAAPLKLDPAKIYFFGHSEGSLTGSLFVSAEPAVKAMVFSGCGGGLVSSLLSKTQPIDVGALVQSFFTDPIDGYHPFLNLMQGYFDDIDPVNHTRRFFREPDAGASPKSLFLALGLDDSYAPDPTILTYALASGVVPVNPQLLPFPAGDLALAGLAFVAAPQSGNVAGGATGVLCEYDPAPNSDGHFVVYDVAAAGAQAARFLGTHAQTGVATLVAAP